MNDQYTSYGLKSSSEEVKNFIKHIIKTNEEFEKLGQKKSSACIWGKHGIGKTELVEQIANELNYKFVYIAPAQFEEMGDLVGMPKIKEDFTDFIPPKWVPKNEEAGILLIDDVNRADERILKGIMQLLQNYELISWKLPKQWHIILTANPDGGDYSVSTMDDAMLTRMMHITMEFDVKAWAKWAENNKVDKRGINFVLTYPEMVAGRLTTPRSLVQFFKSIYSIKDLEKNLPLVQALAASSLEEETVAAFITFVQQNLTELVEPEKILKTKQFERDVESHINSIVDKEVLRVDILATLCTRLSNYLILNNIKPKEAELLNLQKFIKLEILPNDLRLNLLQDLVSSPNKHLNEVINDTEISFMLLENI
ncbi:MAG: AAA family ATPase [Marinifilaceae bacterium]|jgi:hypothetical protein|nr:AAA family ATPase [Marinifilaceae bacterium]